MNRDAVHLHNVFWIFQWASAKLIFLATVVYHRFINEMQPLHCWQTKDVFYFVSEGFILNHYTSSLQQEKYFFLHYCVDKNLNL